MGLLKLFNHSTYAEISALIPKKQKKHMLAECAFNRARHHEFVGQIMKMNRMLFLSFRYKMAYRNKERVYMFLHHQFIGKIVLKFMGKTA
jgi:hypothetical protein